MMEAMTPRTEQGAVCAMCHKPRALVMLYTEYPNGYGESVGYCMECFQFLVAATSGRTLKEALK